MNMFYLSLFLPLFRGMGVIVLLWILMRRSFSQRPNEAANLFDGLSKLGRLGIHSKKMIATLMDDVKETETWKAGRRRVFPTLSFVNHRQSFLEGSVVEGYIRVLPFQLGTKSGKINSKLCQMYCNVLSMIRQLCLS